MSIPATYFEIMNDLNEDYEKVTRKAQEKRQKKSENIELKQTSPDEMWREVVGVAVDITGADIDNSFSVSQAGDYQFFKDKDELAVVDVKTNTLVAYADTGGLVPQKVPDFKLPSPLDKNNLMGKITQNNPTVVLETSNSVLEKAYDFIKPLDPVARVEKLKKKGFDVERAIGFIDSFVDKSIIALSKLKENCSNIANNIVANKLMKSTASKFDEAWNKTEESDYDVGDYRVSKTDNVYQVKDLDENVVISYKKENGELKLLDSNSDRQQLSEALSQTNSLIAVGDANVKYQYNTEVARLNDSLSKYPNGRHELGNGNLLVKKNDSIFLKDANGKKLLVRDKDKKITNISKAQIERVQAAVEAFNNEREQGERVKIAAAAAATILNSVGVTEIEKPKITCKYNLKTQILTYQDRSSGDYFMAKKGLGNSWKNVTGQSNVSKERTLELKQWAKGAEERQSAKRQRQRQLKR